MIKQVPTNPPPRGSTVDRVYPYKLVSTSAVISSCHGTDSTDNDTLSRIPHGQIIDSPLKRGFGVGNDNFNNHSRALKEKPADLHKDVYHQPPLLPCKGFSRIEGQDSHKARYALDLQTQSKVTSSVVEFQAAAPIKKSDNFNPGMEKETLQNVPNYSSTWSIANDTNKVEMQPFTDRHNPLSMTHNDKQHLGGAVFRQSINRKDKMPLVNDMYWSTGNHKHSMSESSQHSVTPPLPPLSPYTTPPITPLHSPKTATLPSTTPQAQQQEINLNHAPDLVTSASLNKSHVKRKSGKAISVKTWDGHSKRTSKGQRKFLPTFSRNSNSAFSSK